MPAHNSLPERMQLAFSGAGNRCNNRRASRCTCSDRAAQVRRRIAAVRQLKAEQALTKPLLTSIRKATSHYRTGDRAPMGAICVARGSAGSAGAGFDARLANTRGAFCRALRDGQPGGAASWTLSARSELLNYGERYYVDLNAADMGDICADTLSAGATNSRGDAYA